MTVRTSDSQGSAAVGTPLTEVIVITRRNLKHVVRTPRLLVFASIQPVMIVLLFRYVFGGAIRAPGINYADYLLPGIFVEGMLLGGTTAVSIATDVASGMNDRFRSLPIARFAFLVARTLADLIRNVLVLALLVVVGLLVGFRFHNGPLGAVGAIGLVLAFGFAFSWLSLLIGLYVRDPETAQVASFLPVFPFIFASSAFVPVETMPGWLQPFTRNQPFSVTVNAVRALTQGGDVGHWLWQSLCWIALFLVVFVPASVALYRRR